MKKTRPRSGTLFLLPASPAADGRERTKIQVLPSRGGFSGQTALKRPADRPRGRPPTPLPPRVGALLGRRHTLQPEQGWSPVSLVLWNTVLGHIHHPFWCHSEASVTLPTPGCSAECAGGLGAGTQTHSLGAPGPAVRAPPCPVEAGTEQAGENRRTQRRNGVGQPQGRNRWPHPTTQRLCIRLHPVTSPHPSDSPWSAGQHTGPSGPGAGGRPCVSLGCEADRPSHGLA